MELMEAMLRRRSVREFTDEAVSEEDLSFILHAAMSGPSAVNRRPYEFYVLKTPEKLEAFRKACPSFANYKAPLAIVVAGDALRFLPLSLSGYWLEDCAAAAENILLAASDRGLGSVWTGLAPDKAKEKRIRKALKLPLHVVPFCIIYVGRAKVPLEPRDKYEESKVHVL